MSNPNRHPAGSSKGGEYAPKGVGGGGVSATPDSASGRIYKLKGGGYGTYQQQSDSYEKAVPGYSSSPGLAGTGVGVRTPHNNPTYTGVHYQGPNRAISPPLGWGKGTKD